MAQVHRTNVVANSLTTQTIGTTEVRRGEININLLRDMAQNGRYTLIERWQMLAFADFVYNCSYSLLSCKFRVIGKDEQQCAHLDMFFQRARERTLPIPPLILGMTTIDASFVEFEKTE